MSPAAPPRTTRGLVPLFAVAAGVIATTLFAAQPLVGIIGPSLGLRGGWAGAGSTLTLLGYAAGLLVLVLLSLGWMALAACRPEWGGWVALPVQVGAVTLLLAVSLVLVSVVALLHTRP